MKPYFEEDGITIYHGDCREILPSLPKVDLVLTDPPYGLGIANNPFRQKFDRSDWDDAPVDAEVLSMVRLAGREQIIWGGNYFPLPPTQCFLIWDKQQPENFSSAMCEQAWTSLKRPAKLFRFNSTLIVLLASNLRNVEETRGVAMPDLLKCGHPVEQAQEFEYDDQETVYVTREMAIDAGDRSMEGAAIPWGVKRKALVCQQCGAQEELDA